MLAKLQKLNEKFGFNIAGEGGEYESLVLDGPNFKKRIVILDHYVKKAENTAEMFIKKAILVDKG